jgi:excisionase family DNA binding protein
MHQRLQFDIRENPASDRRHGSRLTLNETPNESRVDGQNLPSPDCSSTYGRANAASPPAATGEDYSDDGRLMTVQEVAEMLQVKPSWVYQRTRRRNLNRIPGIRLGKYWRFKREEILGWIDQNRK